MREEGLIMDLVGMADETGGNNQSSSNFSEMDFVKTSREDLLI